MKCLGRQPNCIGHCQPCAAVRRPGAGLVHSKQGQTASSVDPAETCAACLQQGLHCCCALHQERRYQVPHGAWDVMQVVVYNKMDLPDSADYWEDIRNALVDTRGVLPEACMAISAVTGQGTQQLVRKLHALLDALPPQVHLLTRSITACNEPVSKHNAYMAIVMCS